MTWSSASFGLTLREYGAACGMSVQAVRATYVANMRGESTAHLPCPARADEEGRVIKFCLPLQAGTPSSASPAGNESSPVVTALETESVIIPMDSYRGTAWHTLCVSSQVGCRMGCTFCETGRMGLRRDLSAAEIVVQRLVARQIMIERHGAQKKPFRYFGDGIQNVVFMGMGEPLDNLDNVIQAIRVLSEQNGAAMPLTQITVSTVGRIDGLQLLAQLARAEPNWRNLRIAISLNAANDALRDRLMPINKGMPLAELQRALCDYPLHPRGRFLVEYVMLKGVNDTLDDADQVAAWCRPLPCIVNLIPYNPQRDAEYETPSNETLLRFLQRLRANGIFVKRRITQGRDLMGACGQLGNPDLRKRPLRAAS